jgi:hypothetical protein
MQYYLCLCKDNQVSWVKKLNIAYLRCYNVARQQYQLWIFKRHGWKNTFLCKKREKEPDKNPDEFPSELIVDHLVSVLREKLYVPKYLLDASLQNQSLRIWLAFYAENSMFLSTSGMLYNRPSNKRVRSTQGLIKPIFARFYPSERSYQELLCTSAGRFGTAHSNKLQSN